MYLCRWRDKFNAYSRADIQSSNADKRRFHFAFLAVYPCMLNFLLLNDFFLIILIIGQSRN